MHCSVNRQRGVHWFQHSGQEQAGVRVPDMYWGKNRNKGYPVLSCREWSSPDTKDHLASASHHNTTQESRLTSCEVGHTDHAK
jgi:hypothetical protein